MRGAEATGEGLTLIDASGLRLAALEQIVTSVPRRPENRDWRDRPKPITDDTLQMRGRGVFIDAAGGQVGFAEGVMRDLILPFSGGPDERIKP